MNYKSMKKDELIERIIELESELNELTSKVENDSLNEPDFNEEHETDLVQKVIDMAKTSGRPLNKSVIRKLRRI